MIDMEEGNVKDFQYLVGKQYVDDEDGFTYQTTMYYLFYCVEIKRDTLRTKRYISNSFEINMFYNLK